ncbi:right-handed parallel beta-helix repeat-containing protein [Solimonas sp. K1W22B-7]|nr:right-handed parallel beta-helix repeat-containing protein [Solimonas sp. K1W22B-7]
MDCTQREAGDGSVAHPWNSLDQASALTLTPGTNILFKRGTVCTGALELRGAGAADRPARVGAYGEGSLPRIDGVCSSDPAFPDAVLLEDVSHVILEDLELTNRGDRTKICRGVHVVAKAEAVVSNVTVQRLHIHNVDGASSPKETGGDGILFDAQASGSFKTRFDGVLVSDNLLEDVYRMGIWLNVAEGARGVRSPSGAWPEAATRVVARGNRLYRIGGDGIVVTGAFGAHIEDNVLGGGNLLHKPITDPNWLYSAGMWAFASNDTVIQRNEVYGMLGPEADGTGFDIDFNQDGTIVQYNYSHDNAGGFILVCDSLIQQRSAVVRYNLSIDDYGLVRDGLCQLPPIGTGGLFQVKVYNNTFVGKEPINGSTSIIGASNHIQDPTSYEFFNNIVYSTTEIPYLGFVCPLHCANNLFFNMLPVALPPFIFADPLFQDAARRGVGREIAGGFALRAGSPAVGTGRTIAGHPDRDYFGNPVPADTAPTIGFYEPPRPTP